ncbi:MAG: extracellular solute-binding protein [Microbacterium sp.]
MRTKLGALALLGVAAAVLGGCSEGGVAGSTVSEAATGDLTVWLIGDDTPESAREYLTATFEAGNAGWTLTIEQKSSADVVESYAAALASDAAPDVVEVTSDAVLGLADAGLLADLTDIEADLGDGGELIGGLVDAGTLDGTLYAAPYIGTGRVVLFSPQIVGYDLPATLEEYVEHGAALTTDAVSGIYAPSKDWYNALPFIWAYGGELAVEVDGAWDAQLSSDASIKGLELLQQVYTTATVAPEDGNARLGDIAFCAGEVGFLSSPAWVAGNIAGEWTWDDEATGGEGFDGCPDTYGADVSAFALPGAEEGETAPIFASGSSIAVTSASDAQTKAEAAVEIMLSEEYQELLAAAGLSPGLTTAATALPDTAVAQAQAEALANSKGTPASPAWAEVEAAQLIPDALVEIAAGGDVVDIATELDAAIEAILNG